MSFSKKGFYSSIRLGLAEGGLKASGAEEQLQSIFGIPNLADTLISLANSVTSRVISPFFEDPFLIGNSRREDIILPSETR